MGAWTRPKTFLSLLSLLPFLYVLALIIDSKITYYPLLKEAAFYDYEFVLLWLLLAPFIFVLPAPTQRAILLARKIYWISVACLVSLILLVAVLVIGTGQV